MFLLTASSVNAKNQDLPPPTLKIPFLILTDVDFARLTGGDYGRFVASPYDFILQRGKETYSVISKSTRGFGVLLFTVYKHLQSKDFVPTVGVLKYRTTM